MHAKTTLGVFALTMLMTGAVDGVNNLPSIAMFGQPLIFFFVMASVLFLLPTGLISAELCIHFPEDSGIFVWGQKGFGSNFGALIIWLQWINTMVWFPTSLAIFVGTAAYLIHPSLTHHPAYLVLSSLAVFWTITLLNLKGIKRSAKLASWGGVLSMLIPMILIITLSFFWVLLKKPLAMHITHDAIFPHLGAMTTWTSLTAVITAFLGMELATVHVRKIHNARFVFPTALICTIFLVIFTMGLGSLGVALVVPHEKILLVSGPIQALEQFFLGFHMGWLKDVLGFMLLFGSVGTMVNWLISPASGLAQAAKHNYLPKILARENVHGVPSNILLLQGLVVSVILCAFFLVPSVNGSYWLLLDLSTELYVLMYFLMFVVAIKLILGFDKVTLIPLGKLGGILVCCLGLLGCTIALVVGFFPPSGINVGSHVYYVSLFSIGIALMCSPAFFLIGYKNKQCRL